VLCKHEVVGSIPSGSTRRSIIDAGTSPVCDVRPMQKVRPGYRFAASHSGAAAALASRDSRLSDIVKRKRIRRFELLRQEDPQGFDCSARTANSVHVGAA
jgi:hypothetical protein